MRKRNTASSSTSSLLFTLLVVAGLIVVQPPTGASERTIVLGAGDAWSDLAIEERIAVRPGRQGYLDLMLEPFSYEPQATTELLLGFDDLPLRDATGRYTVNAAPELVRAAPELTRSAQRAGTGALLVDGSEDRITVVPRGDSAFLPGTEWASFSIEFWFYPVVFEDGATVLSWRAREGRAEGFRTQEIAMEVDRGTIAARFENFFVRPDGEGVSASLRGSARLIPRSWSHHLVRFDARTGLLEYLVDGSPVDVTYVSRTGRQDGSVFFPRVAAFPGEGLVLADGFVGALDELRIERQFVEQPETIDYSPDGGAVVSDYIDLGSAGARLTALDATVDAPGLSDVFLYYRLANLPGAAAASNAASSDWIAIEPGTRLADARGRFVQVRAELYPDTRAGVSPTLSQISLTYEPDPAPLPPVAVRAVPRDGTVELSWAPVQDPDVEGYLVYYGDQSGRYFGTGSEQGVSPIDVGRATSVTLEGLENGTLYFFAVEAYEPSYDGFREAARNELSSEVAARPAKVYR